MPNRDRRISAVILEPYIRWGLQDSAMGNGFKVKLAPPCDREGKIFPAGDGERLRKKVPMEKKGWKGSGRFPAGRTG
jgi:hypothetical protein